MLQYKARAHPNSGITLWGDRTHALCFVLFTTRPLDPH
jgi:hypothetical protein